MAQLRTNHNFLNDNKGSYHYINTECNECNEYKCINISCFIVLDLLHNIQSI